MVVMVVMTKREKKWLKRLANKLAQRQEQWLELKQELQQLQKPQQRPSNKLDRIKKLELAPEGLAMTILIQGRNPGRKKEVTLEVIVSQAPERVKHHHLRRTLQMLKKKNKKGRHQAEVGRMRPHLERLQAMEQQEEMTQQEVKKVKGERNPEREELQVTTRRVMKELVERNRTKGEQKEMTQKQATKVP